MAYVYSRPYIHSFCQIFHALPLSGALDLFRTLEYQMMGVFCGKLKFGSTAALDCRTGQNKGRYCKKEFLLLLLLFVVAE
jgi:hypothetical protein